MGSRSAFPFNVNPGVPFPIFLLILSLIPSAILFEEETIEPTSGSEPIGWQTCQSQELTKHLQDLAQKFPNITRLISIGKSIEGKDIWVMIISDTPNKRGLLKPQVKFVGNINAFSGPSCYVLLRFIEYLLEGYERGNSLERRLIHATEIHILPNLNPDGFRRTVPGVCDRGLGRYNGGGKDLNRDFPDVFNPVDYERQPETKAIMEWMASNHFVLSMSYITGAKVVSYPFDSIPFSEIDAPTHTHIPPDNDIFKHLASTYVQNVNLHLNGSTNPSEYWYCPNIKRTFKDGIVIGADWMPVSGTMLDYNYIHGTFELLVALSCCRNENNEKTLDRIWLDHKMAMLKMIQETEFGVRGEVVDSETWAPLVGAKMRKLYQNFRLNEGTDPMVWHVSSKGEFWRPLLPGKYIMEVYMPGYKEVEVPFEVKPTEYTRLFIKLEKEDPPTTTLPPTAEPVPEKIVTHQNPIFEDENPWAGIEMGDQSHSSGETFNVTYVTQSGTSYQETVEQQSDSDTPASNSDSNRSWLSKLLKSVAVNVKADLCLVTLLSGIVAVFTQ